ncbi:MAG: 50S ribosomal protein L3 [Patescibacteria group bacterium]|nr:50S ribosomal protein L3 [Patescibacteria group bacterium]
MLKVLIGEKIGMTQLFSGTQAVPTSVIRVFPNTVLKIEKEKEKVCVALTYGMPKKENKIKKPILGQIKKAKTLQDKIKEFRIKLVEDVDLKIGDKVTVDSLSVDDKVEVRGVTKGRGFQGVIKRHGFSRGPETHGSHHHRRLGSIGMCSFPARVLKGKKMPGRMGGVQVTIKNLKVVKVDIENNLVYLKGAVPGANGNFIAIKG